MIDIAPTIYQATGIAPPSSVDGVAQKPIEGVAMNYSFADDGAPSTHRSQYFEMLGNRAFYQDGWVAATTPKRMPWGADMPAGDKDKPYRWELYYVEDDFSQSKDLAKAYPDKLKELQAGFDAAAKKYNLMPLDDSFISRFDASLRPSTLDGRTEFTYFPSDTRILGADFPVLNRNWEAVANIETQATNAGGPIVSSGSKFTGWSLYLREGVPMVTYRATDQDGDFIVLQSDRPLPSGKHRISLEVATPDKTKATEVILRVNEVEVERKPVSHLARSLMPAYVGRAAAEPLIEDPRVPDQFTGGTIDQVKIKTQP